MIANDTLTIQIFNVPVEYGSLSTVPIGSVTIVFPSNDVPININQLKALINTTVNILGVPMLLSDILTYDWTFYPFKFEHLRPETFYVKTVMMKTNNSSPYYVRFLGKPIGTMMPFPNNYDANIDYMYPAYATTTDGQVQLVHILASRQIAYKTSQSSRIALRNG
jgi:hypothetical protein